MKKIALFLAIIFGIIAVVLVISEAFDLDFMGTFNENVYWIAIGSIIIAWVFLLVYNFSSAKPIKPQLFLNDYEHFQQMIIDKTQNYPGNKGAWNAMIHSIRNIDVLNAIDDLIDSSNKFYLTGRYSDLIHRSVHFPDIHKVLNTPNYAKEVHSCSSCGHV